MAFPVGCKKLPKSLIESLTQSSPIYVNRRAFTSSTSRRATLGIDALDKTKGDRERVVILGSGYNLAQQLSDRFQTLVISPRNYFVFTPLLNSAAVGTLEFRLALEPVRTQRKPNVEFMQGWADEVSFNQKTVTVEESVVDNRGGGVQSGPDPYRHGSLTDMKNEKFGKRREGKRFDVAYDKLVVAVGCYSQTFGTKGVNENAYFMKDVGDARRIRKRVLECFEMASLPTTAPNLREKLLNFAIIGGGPTGVEFAAELSDLIQVDLSHVYPRLVPMARITVHDVAPKVLSMFDEKLAKYAMKTFARAGVHIKTKSNIEELRRGVPKSNGSTSDEEVADAQGCYTLSTKEEGEEGVGMCVWATGNKMNPFVKRALRKTRRFPLRSAVLTAGKPPTELPTQDWMVEKNPRTGAIVVDDQLRVQMVSQTTTTARNPDDVEQPAAKAVLTDVYALGDNTSIASGPLPATAQVADQQARYLAKVLNSAAASSSTSSSAPASYSQAAAVTTPQDRKESPFKFQNTGIMAYVGNSKAILDAPGDKVPDVSGRAAWLVWRGAYMTKSISWRNRILIPTYWFLNWVFGRDITRF